MPVTATLCYGTHPSQVIHVRQPDTDADAPFPVAVLLHGGWWRDRYDARLMEPLAADLAEAGWLVWNIEYRRTGDDGGGWPRTLDDVRTALDLLKVRLADGAEPGDPSRVVAFGHSAGGHLSLMAALGSPLTIVVGLAPVTDLRTSLHAGLGEGAVSAFLGPDPADELVEDSSPLRRIPIGTVQLIVHGKRDDRVPVEQSRAYVKAARAAGDRVDYIELLDADHFDVIDPAHESWETVQEHLGDL
ncbi:alpha/beta hydrolase [Nocardiopsis gilva YIM 90087]|uniref:Alpha/beta hydrolase n=1 Tax=Nocardiopsis gilva YIM 90087 TaxID=1235441 RepID=A0A223S6A3_9ACTN|nr:alpha/beta fold hydrolase [Nocardiopsis gilva]ASU83628.1 alpha/beta hydrolase [Nocardiopsis gilva YIM 90087]